MDMLFAAARHYERPRRARASLLRWWSAAGAGTSGNIHFVFLFLFLLQSRRDIYFLSFSLRDPSAYTAPPDEDIFSTQYATRSTQYAARKAFTVLHSAKQLPDPANEAGRAAAPHPASRMRRSSWFAPSRTLASRSGAGLMRPSPGSTMQPMNLATGNGRPRSDLQAVLAG